MNPVLNSFFSEIIPRTFFLPGVCQLCSKAHLSLLLQNMVRLTQLSEHQASILPGSRVGGGVAPVGSPDQ